MSQSDMVISDQPGAAFLADLNSVIAALATNSSGATEPATTYAFQVWADTTADRLKIRNAANDGWVSWLVLSTGAPVQGVAAGAITSSGLTQATARMLGRSTAGTGAVEEITVGSGLSLAGGVLDVATPPVVSMVKVRTPPAGAAGYGTTNTRFRRFTTVDVNQGSDITYADSVTLGGLFTVNVPGRYAISYTDQFAAGDYLSITLNDTVPTGVPLAAEILASDSIAGANVSANCSWTAYLPAGSLIRARTQNGTSSGTQTQYGQFTISRAD